MAGPLGGRLAGCAWVTLAMLAGMSNAYAATGRITFSGAVVEPTCSVNTERVAAWMAAMPKADQSRPAICGGSNAPTPVSQTYAVTVVRLSDAEPDRVLRYFSDYVRAGGTDAPSPALVTQTYD